MSFMGFIGILKTIGGLAGAIMTIIAFLGLISKKPRELFRKAIREESKAANKTLEDNIDQLLKDNEASKKRDIVSLRHSITTIYEEYSGRKCFPTHVKEDMFSLYGEYEKLGGNSYVHSIVEEMKQWKTE